MKTAELTGMALNWAVTQCENFKPNAAASLTVLEVFNPQGNWAQGGPIIERESTVQAGRLTIKNRTYATQKNGQTYCAYYDGHNWEAVPVMYGATPLIAAMRCYVASRLGTDVAIPKELL